MITRRLIIACFVITVAMVYITYEYNFYKEQGYITHHITQLWRNSNMSGLLSRKIISLPKQELSPSSSSPSSNRLSSTHKLPFSKQKSPSERQKVVETSTQAPVKKAVQTSLQSSSQNSQVVANDTKNGTFSNKTKDIYARFKGRFGNVIFQFAAIYGVKLAANCEKIFFNDNGQAGRLMRFFPKLKNFINLIKGQPPGLIRITELGPNKYHKKTTDDIVAATGDVYFHGWLGVPSYWYPKYDKEMKELLVVSEDLQTQARNYLIEICSGHEELKVQIKNLKQGVSRNPTDSITELVGIQIRRGDKTHLKNWPLPERSYFEKAMDYFRKKFRKVYFIIVSEDKNWAKENIMGDDVIYSMEKADLLELALLTLCDHTIMSVGTFSWWAAYLAGGEAVYYPNHTKPKSRVATFFNDTQYFLPHWKPIL